MIAVEDCPAVIRLIGRLHELGLNTPAGGYVAGPAWMAPDVDWPAQRRQELEEVRMNAVGRQLKIECLKIKNLSTMGI